MCARPTKGPYGTLAGTKAVLPSPQTSHRCGLVVKCILQNLSTAPVFNLHMLWAGRWRYVQLVQGFWNILRWANIQGFPNAVTPKTTQVSPGPLCSAWVRDGALCGHTRPVLSLPPVPEVGPMPAESSRWLDHGQASVFTGQCWLIRGIQVRWEGRCRSWDLPKTELGC